MVLHFLLFIANFLYLLYEVNVNFTPVFFTMLLLTDITGVWCFLLITSNSPDSHQMMSTSSNKGIRIMGICLIVSNIGSYFLPDHWGVRCSQQAPPLGPAAFTIFYIIWTVFTIKVLRADPLLALKQETKAGLWATFK